MTETNAPRPRDDAAPSGDPEFGPRGYLPERAAKRARKIVLRAPMGLQWVIAAIVAGLVVAVAGVVLLTRDAAPGPPYVALGPVDAYVGEVARDERLEVLVVGVSTRVRALVAPPDVVYCPASGRLEAPDGAVWSLTGRAFEGGTSLPERPTVTVDGILYLDPSAAAPPPTPSPDPATPACV